MLEVVVFAVRGFKVERFFGDERGNILVLLFLSRFCGFSRHDDDDKMARKLNQRGFTGLIFSPVLYRYVETRADGREKAFIHLDLH